MSIKIFFHICAIGHCVQVIEEQLQAILYSGLYEKVEGIYCYVTGSNDFSVKYISTLVSLYGKKIKLVKSILNDTTFERLTLEHMHSLISPEDRVLYIHSKGVTQTEPEKITNTSYWTRAMNYHLIGKHMQCLQFLEDGNDVIGTYYSESPAPHFPGNFWWSTGRYYLSLPQTIGPRYLDPEMYIFTNTPSYKALSIVPKDITDLYKKSLLPTYYLDEDDGKNETVESSSLLEDTVQK
jgi:hypothetical protein